MEIQDIKQKLTLSQVLDHYHLKPDKHAKLNCPFHDDKTPSMQVYYKTHTWTCFSGNCDAGSGDAIEFCVKMEGDKHRGILVAQSLVNGTSTQAQQLSRTAVLTKMFTYFRNGLHNSNPAQDYIQSRSLDRNKIEVGYNSGQFHHGSRRDEQLIKSCLKYGLLLDRGHVNNKTGEKAYSPFGKGCIAFALRNPQHQVVSLYFRSITENQNGKHYYLKDRQGLYPKYPGREAGSPAARHLIITESIIDAATLLQQDLKGYQVLALYGTNGLTIEHMEAMSRLKELEEIILFLDGDEAGNQAAEKYSKQLESLNVAISKVETPEGEDINSLAQSHEPEIFKHLIENRKTFSSSPGGRTLEKEKPSEINPQPTLDTTNPERIIYTNNWLTATVWGGIEKENLSRLKISLHIKSESRSFRDDVNLYSHMAVKKLIQNVAETLELSTTLVNHTITDLTEQLESYRMEERATQIRSLKPKLYEMSAQEVKQAEKFLQSSDLVRNTLTLISQSGLIGEQRNGLLLFFLYLSRYFEEPLHAIIFGRSGSGKTYLQTKVSECLPEESVRTITSLTENTLYYSSKDFWKHKVLLIEDLDGVYNAFLPLREFMSKQSITKLTTDKDAKGNNVQKVLTVEGPICVSGATTKEGIYEDNANRSYLLHINEGIGHMEEVMDYQRKLQAGLVDESGQSLARQLLKNTQRLLKPIKIINPYATQLKIPESVFKKLRTNMHYLKLIETITFWHQCQREKKRDNNGGEYIQTTLEDISWANRLVKESLLRKSDELNGQLRSFFESLKAHINKQPEDQKTFYSKQVREHFRMNPMKANRYLRELDQWGYIKKVGGYRNTGFEYEIIAWEEYDILQSRIDILDHTLQKLKDAESKKAGNNNKKSSITLV